MIRKLFSLRLVKSKSKCPMILRDIPSCYQNTIPIRMFSSSPLDKRSHDQLGKVESETILTSNLSSSDVIFTNPIEIQGNEELQDHWKMLESRVVRRKPRVIESTNSSFGRSQRNGSAWDAEVV